MMSSTMPNLSKIVTAKISSFGEINYKLPKITFSLQNFIISSSKNIEIANLQSNIEVWFEKSEGYPFSKQIEQAKCAVQFADHCWLNILII